VVGEERTKGASVFHHHSLNFNELDLEEAARSIDKGDV
jgi:hypothetical protein